MRSMTIKPAESFNYYGETIFWTSFEVFLARLCELISGDPTVWWHIHIQRKYGPQNSAFILNCGNGWVERDLYERGLIRSCVAIDIMPKHIEEASTAAGKVGMPASYFVADANNFEPRDLRADIAVNVGAMHHVAYINRMTEILARVTQDGLYIGYDYTGAHRNQYSWKVWSRVLEVNQELPEKYRARLRYPHMRTMLASDPSEAVHSELQIEVLQRHFDFLEHCPLGGGVANALLYNNFSLYEDRNTPDGRASLDLILKAEVEASGSDPDFNLYTFFVAKPKKHGSVDPDQLRRWQSEENEREARAAATGRYYRPSPLELIYNELADTEYKLSLAQRDLGPVIN